MSSKKYYSIYQLSGEGIPVRNWEELVEDSQVPDTGTCTIGVIRHWGDKFVDYCTTDRREDLIEAYKRFKNTYGSQGIVLLEKKSGLVPICDIVLAIEEGEWSLVGGSIEDKDRPEFEDIANRLSELYQDGSLAVSLGRDAESDNALVVIECEYFERDER